MTPELAVERIADLYQRHGNKDYGEVMTQVQHAVQAGRLAVQQGADEELVLAAVLHDIGHLLVHEVPQAERDQALLRHQLVGADYLLELGFSARLAELVRRHVDGKRYLTAIDPGYLSGLSPASVESLGFQGGPMSPAEVDAFEALPDREQHLRLRQWDDLAKQADDPDLDMQPFLEMALRHLQAGV